jgi:VanZ family protein
MSNDHRTPTPRQNWLRWTLFVLALTVWTVLLLSPRAPLAVAAVVSPGYHFLVAKTAHVSGYALLAVLVGCLPVRWPLRVAWWLVLIFHAAATEYLQTFIPGRFGSWRDVGLDLVGLALGLATLWGWRYLRRA